MRHIAILALGVGLLISGSAVSALAMIRATLPVASAVPLTTKAGYYCSPGFVASYGRCIATASTDEVDLYLNEPTYTETPSAHVYRHHRRHGLHERY